MINSYPTVDFSEKLIEISKSKPTLPQIPSKPTKPSEPVANSEGIGCGSSLFTGIAVFCSLICVIALFTSQIQAALIFGLVAGGAFLILYFIGSSQVNKEQQNIENAKQYKLKCKKYEEDLLVYNKNKEDYESQIIIRSSIEYILKYRNELLEKQRTLDKQLYKDLSKTKLSFTSAAISFFEPFLTKEFSNDNILQMVVLNNFCLHFLLFDESGIIINIEIDEPYFDNTGMPKNSIDDINENKFNRISSLKKQNITTVIFCEEQVFKHPNECVEFILKVKKTFLENKTYIYDSEFPYTLPMWNKEQAHSMAFMRYRNSYIPEKYHELLKFESLLRYDERQATNR